MKTVLPMKKSHAPFIPRNKGKHKKIAEGITNKYEKKYR
jgi:hypothetical protein